MANVRSRIRRRRQRPRRHFLVAGDSLRAKLPQTKQAGASLARRRRVRAHGARHTAVDFATTRRCRGALCRRCRGALCRRRLNAVRVSVGGGDGTTLRVLLTCQRRQERIEGTRNRRRLVAAAYDRRRCVRRRSSVRRRGLCA